MLKDGENPESPLHECFVWDDTEAAHLHRLTQARKILRSIRVVYVGEEAPRRRFVHVQIEKKADGYVQLPTAMSDDVMKDYVMSKARADLLAWKERYQELEDESLDSLVLEVFPGVGKERA